MFKRVCFPENFVIVKAYRWSPREGYLPRGEHDAPPVLLGGPKVNTKLKIGAVFNLVTPAQRVCCALQVSLALWSLRSKLSFRRPICGACGLHGHPLVKSNSEIASARIFYPPKSGAPPGKCQINKSAAIISGRSTHAKLRPFTNQANSAPKRSQANLS